MQASDFKVGQLVQRSYEDDKGRKTWEYAIVIEVFDDRVNFIREYGSYHMYPFVTDDSEKKFYSKDCMIIPLFKNGKPAMAKRSIFGKYKFQPK